MPSPAVTVVTPSLLVMDRSALVLTVSVSVAVLLLGLVSGVELVVVTVSVCGPGGVEAGTVKVTVMLLLALARMVPKVAVKLPPVPGVTVPNGLVMVPWVKPAGQVSLIDTLSASDGPALPS